MARPAVKPLTAAGRTASDGALVREVEQLRRRATQQDETTVRLVEALRTLRRGCQALREENRELRAALEHSRLRAQADEEVERSREATGAKAHEHQRVHAV
jgi:hypothetical protein